MRKFLGLLLGSATIEGFETTFGLSKWKPFEPPRKVYSSVNDGSHTHSFSTLPGGVTWLSPEQYRHFVNP